MNLKDAYGFSVIRSETDWSDAHLHALFGRIESVGEAAIGRPFAFSLIERPVLTICENKEPVHIIKHPSHFEFKMPIDLNAGDIGFLWGAAFAIANTQLPRDVLLRELSKEEGIKCLNHRWQTIETSISTIANGVLARADAENAPDAAALRELKDLMKLVVYAAGEGEVMMSRALGSDGIARIAQAYARVTGDHLREETLTAISSLLELRAQCLSEMYSVHSMNKPIVAQCNFLSRLHEAARFHGEDPKALANFAIGGITGRIAARLTGENAILFSKFLPTDVEMAQLEPAFRESLGQYADLQPRKAMRRSL